jgi:uncharacterized membrane protein YphA (DoxX/SURF4 family)
MVAVGLMIWLSAAALAYYNMKAVFVSDNKMEWDKATKEFVLIASLLLGPLFLLISIEVRVLAAVGKGLATNKTRSWKDV